jgi:hypothetical protein
VAREHVHGEEGHPGRHVETFQQNLDAVAVCRNPEIDGRVGTTKLLKTRASPVP